MNPDRSLPAAGVVLIALLLLASTFFAPWFVYDFNSGRQTPPDGPQPEDETGVVTHQLNIGLQGWEGDVEPSDAARANQAILATTVLLGAAGGLLLLMLLGELPALHRLIGRNVALGCLALAMLCAIAGVVVAAAWIPESMGGHGIEGPYTARLDEPDGYTRGYMHIGWYVSMLAAAVVFVAGLIKFQAGPPVSSVLQAHLNNQSQ